MFKIILSVIILSIAIIANGDVNYQLHHQNDRIHVIADFGKQDKNIVELHVPHIICGTNYDKQIKNLKLQNGSYNVKKSITTTKNHSENLIIEYDLVNSEDCKKTLTDKYYHFFDKDKFYLIGHGAFIYPKNLSDKENITININSDAKEIIINNENKSIVTRAINTKLENLNATLIFGSNEFNRKIFNKDLDIIIWGDNTDSSKSLFDITNKIVKIQKNFWKDRDFKKTIVFIINPFSDENKIWGATNFGNLMLNFVSPNAIQYKDFKNFLAHENFHTWFRANMGFIAGPKYFTEGFTDYFAHLINMQNKVISKDDFIKKYNKVLNRYFSSLYKDATDEETENMFWWRKDAQRIPYVKGFIIAHELDLKIQAISNNKYSLKDIFFAMLKEARVTKSKLIFSPELLLSYIKKVTEQDLSQELQSILKPNMMDLNNKILRNYSLNYKDIQIIDYEFDYIKSISCKGPARIIGLKKDSNPYKAGLRNNQKFTGIRSSISNYEDLSQNKCEIEMKLQNKKVIKYIPKTKTIQIPFYK